MWVKVFAELSLKSGGERELEEVPEIHEVADNSEFQLDDDYSLLDLIIKDMETSDVLYQPTMYWKKYTTEAVELSSKRLDYGTFAAEGKGFYPVSAA